MTLPPFDLHRAESVDEAKELLERYGEDAAVICGGTELLLLLKLGFAAYGHLVDIKPIGELGGIRAENGAIVVGSTVTHREIERSPLVLELLPSLAAMERRVANIRVRNVGTLGGNLCFSDPHSDPATFLLALDAEAEYDRRRMPLSEFLVGPYETALGHGPVACAVRVEGGAVAEARIAVGAVGARAVRATAAERALTGCAVDDTAVVAGAAALAAEASEAVDDANGSAAYKEQLVRVLVARCFADATTSG